MTPTVWRGAPGRVGEAHAVAVERRDLVAVEDPAVAPGVEQGGGPLVAVTVAVVVVRQLQADDVGRAPGLQGDPFGLGDDVVGRADHVVEGHHVRSRVAEAGEGLEAGHAFIVVEAQPA